MTIPGLVRCRAASDETGSRGLQCERSLSGVALRGFSNPDNPHSGNDLLRQESTAFRYVSLEPSANLEHGGGIEENRRLHTLCGGTACICTLAEDSRRDRGHPVTQFGSCAVLPHGSAVDFGGQNISGEDHGSRPTSPAFDALRLSRVFSNSG